MIKELPSLNMSNNILESTMPGNLIFWKLSSQLNHTRMSPTFDMQKENFFKK